MTISNLVMIVALVIGAGTSNESVETETATLTCGVDRVCKIGTNCWINGVWYNPCPSDAPYPPPNPTPYPEILLP